MCPVLVGRDELLALTDRRWHSAQEGSGQLLLLAGEAGIGKTRLLGDLAGQIDGPGRVISAVAFPRDAEAAGGVLFDLVGGLRRAGATVYAERLRAVLHDVGTSADPAHRRRTFVADLSDILVDLLTDDGPIFLSIEDLHWADELSLDVLARVAVRVHSAPALIVASYRSDELYPRTALRRWRYRLLGQRLAEEVRLPRLDAADTGRMAEAIIGEVPPSLFIDALFERSDGIPLHIEELIAGGTPASVPDTVAEAMIARVAALKPRSRAIVTAASVIGRSFDIDLLAAITGETTDAIDAALQELADRHIVHARTDGTSFDFRHALIRDAIYDSIPPNRRRRLHASVAAAAAAAGFRPAFLSDQFERANRPDEAHRHALAAAADAVRMSAHREAAGLYRRAHRTMPGGTEPAVRATLLTLLADELAAIDDNEGAEAQYALAVGLHRGLGDEAAAAALVPRLMAVRHLLGANLQDRAALARDALSKLDVLPGGGPALVRAHLLAALAAAHMLDRRLDEAMDYGRQAELAIAGSALGDSAIEVRVNIDATLGSVLLFAGHADDGWNRLERAIRDGERAGAEGETARGYRMIGSSASVLVEYERGEHWLPRAVAYAARTECWNDHHYLTAHLAHVHWAVGDWAAAEREAHQALADGRGGITTRVTVLHVLGYLALGRDQRASARDHLEEAREIGARMDELQRLSPALWGLAELALYDGHPDVAVELCERGYADSARVADAAYLFPFLLTGVRALLALRNADAAGDWAVRCGDLLRRRGIAGTLPAIDHADGLVELAAGNTGTARVLLERAAVGWQQRRRFWEGSQALGDLAWCAKRSKRPADASFLVAQLRAVAAPVGAVLLDRLADAVGVGDGDGSKGPLTVRELEVAVLVASGSTNREIAASLTISPKTVAAHVEHILAKLGAARRAEIAAWVVTRGN